MNRFLLLALTAGLSSAAIAGIPESKQTKWVRVNKSSITGPGIWLIDTEDIEVKGYKLRFWVERKQGKIEKADGNKSPSKYNRVNWTGKYRVNCKDFTSSIHPDMGSIFGGNYRVNQGKIRQSQFSYALADNFCFLTGAPGYTKNANPPKWVRSIIRTVQAQ